MCLEGKLRRGTLAELLRIIDAAALQYIESAVLAHTVWAYCYFQHESPRISLCATMLPIRRLPHTRIPHLRPLRPPSSAPRPRAFTQSRPDHLLNRSSRPQLPYLSQPSPFRTSQGTLLGPNPHLARLLSTESRTYVREQVYLAAKWTGIIWTFLVLGGIAYVGIQIEMDERRQPTPDEWSFSTRWHLRVVRAHLRAGE